MLITQPVFYRKYGIRTIAHLMSPVLSPMTELTLPQYSIYHYVTFDGVEDGPPNDDYLFRELKRPVMVDHISDLTGVLGAPRRQAAVVNTVIRDYHNTHRKTRYMRNLAMASKESQTLIVYNYCMLNKFYRYVKSFYTEYYKWSNVVKTVVDNIAATSAETDRQHYLVCGVPTLIPGLHQFDLASKEMNQMMLKIFKNKDTLFLLELWKWLSTERETSLLSAIPNNKLHLVNVVFLDYGNWFVVNLGVLNGFREHSPLITDFMIEYKQKLTSVQLQKRLLRMMMFVMEARVKTLAAEIKETNDAELVKTDEVSAEDDADLDVEVQLLDNPEEDDEDTEVVVNPDVDLADPNSAKIDLNKANSKTPEVAPNTPPEVRDYTDNVVLDEDFDNEALLLRIKEEDTRLDHELNQLNQISQQRENELNTLTDDSLAEIINFKEPSLESGILDKCDDLMREGLMTPNQYQRFSRLANSYKTIIAQDGKSTLENFITISQEEIEIKESPRIKDNDTVLDKTMLSSSLLELDEKYIEKILSRDVASMVMNTQKSGIAITGYKVEKVIDVLGGYEIHTVKMNPVEGMPSTVRFKLPIINRDGTFTSNGVNYRLRKQRGDMPIRKTGTDRVALTSYYGKTFINRGRKKIYDYGYWLNNQITDMILNKEDNSIKEAVAEDVFDNRLKSPRVYSAISQQYKSFKCRGYSLLFDHNEMLKTFPNELVKKYERMGNLIIGINKTGNVLVIDINGSVYYTKDNELVLFGTMESFLNIPTNNAPTEFAEVSVFGKEVPIGVVLSYQMGLEKLMRLLKVEPRRVAAGTRVNLQEHEYALSFSDETLVFSKDNRFASMILGGFNEYHRAIKTFSVYSFNSKGVYLNLLEANGLSIKYLNEMDLINKMFIDPITRELLIQMKEPVTFQGLLLRACDMLLDDKHPDEGQTGPYVREKGYERLSGAVYTEMIQAIRFHNGKLGKQTAQIELHPYAVWKRITEDPSKTQVKEINPIESLKDVEAVTYSGTGGRNRRSMTKSTRQFHPDDMGVVSESTVDSSDVAINVFLSADPQYSSLRGTHKPYDYKKQGVTALLSTSALMSAGADRDDPKRVKTVVS